MPSESAYLKSDQIGTPSARRPPAPEQKHPANDTAALAFPVVRRRYRRVVPSDHHSLRQHDLDGAHVRRAAVLGGHLLRRDANVPHLRVRDESAPNDLRDVDGPGDRTPAGSHHHFAGTAVEMGDDREDVIHRRLLPDVDDARVDRERAPTGTGPNPPASY